MSMWDMEPRTVGIAQKVSILFHSEHEDGAPPDEWIHKARFEWHVPPRQEELRSALESAGAPQDEIEDICAPDEKPVVKLRLDGRDFFLRIDSLDWVLRWLMAKAEHEGLEVR